jgi:hypothetical protein
MVISTDATLHDFNAALSEPAAEVRSKTSGSGRQGSGSTEPISPLQRNEDGGNLKTGVGLAEEIPLAVSKEGARKIAELTSDDEYNSLVSDRRALVRQQLETGLGRGEILQLRLIEWTINCVERSRVGLNLDSLEQIA